MTAPVRQVRQVTRQELPDAVAALLADAHRLVLVACHEDPGGFRVVYAFAAPSPDRRVELVVTVPRDDAWIPSLAGVSFAASRFEREIRDLYGVRPEGHPLPQRLVRHAHWPVGWYPMLAAADPDPAFGADAGSPPFNEVRGEGVYEIPVGPVHAGLIEPGHFRFSVVGETIVRMKARLWFLHRGMERLFEGRPVAEGVALAEVVSGDTAVGHGLAFALAAEEALGLEVADEDRLIRALLLELERVHCHVADLGMLANDVGFGIANTHAQRIRERLLRLNRAVTGHRLLRGGVVVGGARVIALPDPAALREVAADTEDLVGVTLGNGGVRDRFTGTAVLAREQAQSMETLGYVARASGVDVDARRDHPFADLGSAFTVVVEDGGDVLARYGVRAREIDVSLRVAMGLVARLNGARGSGPRHAVTGRAGSGLGIAEAWRGRVTHRVELDADGVLTRVKIVDPSFNNWPALPVALADTIVPDFPLANKSFNQSYAGNDL